MATIEELQGMIHQLTEQLAALSNGTTTFSKVLEWHAKAKVDYFSAYIIEYLAFITYLKDNYPSPTERNIIQAFKCDGLVRDLYFEKIESNQALKTAWSRIKNELDREGLGESKYWDNNTLKANQTLERGSIKDFDDWVNMIEVIYCIRNNLFHGSKDPNNARDELLVTVGYQVLRKLVEILIKFELNRTNLK